MLGGVGFKGTFRGNIFPASNRTPTPIATPTPARTPAPGLGRSTPCRRGHAAIVPIYSQSYKKVRARTSAEGADSHSSYMLRLGLGP